MARHAAISNEILTAALTGLEAQRDRLTEQIEEVRSMLGGRRPGRPKATPQPNTAPTPAPRKRRRMSAAAIERIRAAQKARWAAFRKSKAGEGTEASAPAKKAPAKRGRKATKEAAQTKAATKEVEEAVAAAVEGE